MAKKKGNYKDFTFYTRHSWTSVVLYSMLAGVVGVTLGILVLSNLV